MIMTCRELTDFLDDYLAGNLSALTRFTFQLHLGLCRSCRDYLRTYRDTIHMARAVFSDPAAAVPHSVPEGLIQAILAARTQNRPTLENE
jgi:predicted anti-sigma-YlaC factor YlaD